MKKEIFQKSSSKILEQKIAEHKKTEDEYVQLAKKNLETYIPMDKNKYPDNSIGIEK
jgi:hypothetical protein